MLQATALSRSLLIGIAQVAAHELRPSPRRRLTRVKDPAFRSSHVVVLLCVVVVMTFLAWDSGKKLCTNKKRKPGIGAKPAGRKRGTQH